MSVQKKIKKLQLRNFRSYKEEIFDIDENINLIVLYGNNGLGKTAFFDALEWGLTGSLKRYDNPSKEKNEYPVLSNIFKKNEESSFVNMIFSDDTSILRQVNKKGEGDFNSGIIKNGFDIDKELVHDYYKDSVNFSSSFSFSQFLSQELINSFIRSNKDTDRYNSVVSLFGLSRYVQYQKFAREVLSNIKQRKSFMDVKVSTINDNINKEKLNYSEINIDIKLKREELNNLIIDKIDFADENSILSNLEKIKAESFKIKDENEKQINMHNQYVIELSALNNSFDEKEKVLNYISTYKANEKVIKTYIDILEKNDKVSYILKNLSEYLNYKKDEIKLTDLEKQQRESSKIYRNLQESKGVISLEVSVLKDIYNSDYVLIKEYNDLIQNIQKNKTEVLNLEDRLKEKSSIKQQFLRITTNYLKDNIGLNQCPVCQNNFDINDTIKSLTEEIEKESNEIFLDIRSKINIYKASITNDDNKLKDIMSRISSKVKELELDYNKNISNINKKIQSLKLLKEVYLKVKYYLNELGISENEIKSYNETIKSRISELNINEDIEYYKMKHKDTIEKINEETKMVSSYLSDKQKYKVEKKEDIIRNINKYNECIEKFNALLSIHGKVIKISEEINMYYKNYFSRNKLINLNKESKRLKVEYEALNFIEKEFNKLDENSRSTIEIQTETILSTYQDTIKKIYKYLNPNLKFDDFNFKIDGTNPKNNRMILEVTGTNGYKMSPAYSFSSAQNNVLAISIFLSFALTQSWSNLNCIFMDDPIQNMDDININNFVDILRNIIKKTNKQIFISTHDERIYNFIRNKFKSKIQTFEFEDYGKIRTEVLI
jgi:uncharacterized protein (UPF0212 family)